MGFALFRRTMINNATVFQRAQHFGSRDACFLFTSILALAVGSGSLVAWFRLSLSNDSYSHLVLIPFVSFVLIYRNRREIFSRDERAADGMLLMITGISFYSVARWGLADSGQVGTLTLAIFGIVTFLAGTFRFFYGRHAWEAARFPILFLCFMVPAPTILLGPVIHGLQFGSAVVADGLFSLLRVPHVWKGFQFDLPGLSIEIAEECSGIRSSIALLVVTVLMAHLALSSRKRKLLLIASVLPLVLFKNVRMTSLVYLPHRISAPSLLRPQQVGGVCRSETRFRGRPANLDTPKHRAAAYP